MRRTIAADMTTREPDQNDRRHCSSCDLFVLDGFEAAHEDAHFKNRDAARPVFTFVAAVAVEHDPAAREGGGYRYGPTTEAPRQIL